MNVDNGRCLFAETTSFDESESRFKAASGMMPSGKEVESDIGSSLHSGHITDPFPYAFKMVVDFDMLILREGA